MKFSRSGESFVTINESVVARQCEEESGSVGLDADGVGNGENMMSLFAVADVCEVSWEERCFRPRQNREPPHINNIKNNCPLHLRLVRERWQRPTLTLFSSFALLSYSCYNFSHIYSTLIAYE